ncbi:IS66 family transposase [Maribrevibacterium harenarium]|uniref:IS66 family transposase n=1 Tax=Maribrevibacterium harenarium TaxID=2589817 RepID=A0A501W3V3_9GAMM|nr:IS66 family transposase [Maribrevibacterium harenarium]TPE43442.1 IS66 family transposase [Maribrevibacterium harenarium]
MIKAPVNDLPDDIELLKKMLLEQSQLLARKEQEVAQWQSRYHHILDQWRLAQHRQFGKSSEVSPGQGELFDEAQSIELETEESVDATTSSAPRKQPKRKPLPKDLPRETVVLDIADEDKVCDCCQGELHCIGEDTSERLEFIPAQLKVIETVRPKYACRACDHSGTSVTIKQQKPEPSLIPKGIATPSLLSQIITGKFQYSLPLYRQETLFKQYDIELSRRTMSDWMQTCSKALQPLYDRLKQILLEQPALHADETTLKVIKEDRPNCYMWVYCSGTDSPSTGTHISTIPNIVLYDFRQTRSGSCPKDYLGEYSGYLHVDGYAAYNQTSATLVGCWAHARRKFKEYETLQPKGKTGTATVGLAKIQKLYAIETQAKQLETSEERYAFRQAHAPAALADYKVWLDKNSLKKRPPKDKLTLAINYSLNQWDNLTRYLESADLNIDNNRAERAIKPFVIGRKNWMFANTANGAQSSAVLYSIIETAKTNGLVPYDYLVAVLEKLPKLDRQEELEGLLPWNIGEI